MRFPTRHRHTAGRLLGGTVWCVLLGGLFAMHGLGDHGGAGHEMGITAGPPQSTTIHHGEHEPAPAASAMAAAMTQILLDPPASQGGMAMAGLCLAVLLGTVLAFLLALANRRALLAVGPALTVLRAPVATFRDRDPPCLHRLSIQRC